METITQAKWKAWGQRLFGEDAYKWRFVCPACGHIASVQDYKDAGVPETAVAFSCVGRWMDKPRGAFDKGPGPCDYAGGGLITLGPLNVIMDNGRERRTFAFAERES